jgi:hypothetical protein
MKTVKAEELQPGDILVNGSMVVSVDPSVVSTTSTSKVVDKDIVKVYKNNVVEIVFERPDGKNQITASYHWSKNMLVEVQ